MKPAPTLVSTALAISLLSSPAWAAPVTVSIDSVSWNTAGASWQEACTASGCDNTHSFLNLSWTIATDWTNQPFELSADNQSKKVLFGQAMLAEEDGTISAAEKDDLALWANIVLSSPEGIGSSSEATVLAYVGILKDQGNQDDQKNQKSQKAVSSSGDAGLNPVDVEVSFKPILMSFADGSVLELVLSPLFWNCQGNDSCVYDPNKPQGSQPVYATFTLVKEAAPFPAAVAPTAIPEPSSLALLGIGLLGMGLRPRRRT